MAKGNSSYFLKRLQKHFGTDPAGLVLVSQSFAPYDRPNIHLAIDKLLKKPGTSFELDGVIMVDSYENPSLAKLSREATARRFLPGPVEYHDVDPSAVTINSRTPPSG